MLGGSMIRYPFVRKSVVREEVTRAYHDSLSRIPELDDGYEESGDTHYRITAPIRREYIRGLTKLACELGTKVIIKKCGHKEAPCECRQPLGLNHGFGLYESASGLIIVDGHLPSGQLFNTIAHELTHHVLHHYEHRYNECLPSFRNEIICEIVSYVTTKIIGGNVNEESLFFIAGYIKDHGDIPRHDLLMATTITYLMTNETFKIVWKGRVRHQQKNTMGVHYHE